MPTKNIFCAKCQTHTPHTVAVDKHSDLVCTCPCGLFLKFPSSLGPEGVQKSIDAEESSNKGKVLADVYEAAEAASRKKALEVVNSIVSQN